MKEMFWFGRNREKQRLMSEAVENARIEIEALKSTGFERGTGIGRTFKKAFTPFEFSPKSEDGKKPLLTENEIVEALGVNPDASFEDAPFKIVREKNYGKQGLWPTLIPDLYYIKADDEDYMGGYGYFVIAEGLEPSDSGEEVQNKINKKDRETLAEWNEKMWSRPDPDKEANQELTDEFGRTPDKKN